MDEAVAAVRGTTTTAALDSISREVTELQVGVQMAAQASGHEVEVEVSEALGEEGRTVRVQAGHRAQMALSEEKGEERGDGGHFAYDISIGHRG